VHPQHKYSCGCCGSNDSSPILNLSKVPVQNTSLFHSCSSAILVVRGDLNLLFCRSCGFLFNSGFDKDLPQYSEEYEETQGYSPTFARFHTKLAQDVIKRYDLKGKRILEIGCGKGEFLSLLCKDGANTGVGIDPAFRIDRHPDPNNPNLYFEAKLFNDGMDISGFDFICCKMTLEHIPDVLNFLRSIVSGLGDAPTQLFFQVPDVERILKEFAFWDVYYEHCSYFTSESLSSVFLRAGLCVDTTWTDYDGQYLMISARWLGSCIEQQQYSEPSPDLRSLVSGFHESVSEKTETWRTLFDLLNTDEKVIIWGGGSKAVAFISLVGCEENISAVVDINPYKQGTFLPGSGLVIVSPNDLPGIKPDKVIVMNPIYSSEIRELLLSMNLQPEMVGVNGLSL
jgi:SAM-dependent methyltransferase